MGTIAAFSLDFAVRSNSGRALLGARNGPLALNVEDILDDGRGMSIEGKLAFGAVIERVFSFGVEDLSPKQEQSAKVEDFVFSCDFGSIDCFSAV